MGNIRGQGKQAEVFRMINLMEATPGLLSKKRKEGSFVLSGCETGIAATRG
jgi:hypothetical protein